jgi:hypothetical protein
MDNEGARSSSSTMDAAGAGAGAVPNPRVAASSGMSFGNNAILKAQERLKTVTLKQLERLQAERGWSRGRAVRELLSRISTTFSTPSRAEVRRVCDHFGLAADDAIRAIFVKHELTRLNSAGLNTLAAIEVLTRRISGDALASSHSRASDAIDGSASRSEEASAKKRGAASAANPALRAFKRLRTLATEQQQQQQQKQQLVGHAAAEQSHDKRCVRVPGFGVFVDEGEEQGIAEGAASGSSGDGGVDGSASGSSGASATASSKRDRSSRMEDGGSGLPDRRASKRRR